MDFFLFPLAKGSKKPPAGFGWTELSSCDPEQWTAWSKQYPGCNWGLDCGRSGLIVVDVDPDKGGEEAFQELAKLGLPECPIVRTPRGGRHLYYAGRAKTTASDLGPGLDTRGVGGYVVYPGSVVNGRRYEGDLPDEIPPAPDWLLNRLALGTSAKDERTLAEPDKPENVAQATAWLLDKAPLPVEGERDQTCYKVGCRLRDMGLSEAMAMELAVRLWLPKWEYEDFGSEAMERCFASAFKYATGAAGADTRDGRNTEANEAFSEVDTSTNEPAPEAPTVPFLAASEILTRSIPPTRWLLGHRIACGYINVVLAPGGVGKSTLSFADALSVASGKPLLGDHPWLPGTGSLVCNFEDDLDELMRRQLACARHYGLEDPEILRHILLTSGPTHGRLVLARTVQQTPVIVQRNVDALCRTIERNNVSVVFGDPFVRSHSVNENDNMAIDLVAQAWDRVAKSTGCAVVLVHHTRKTGNDEEARGNMDTARGASSLVSAARSAWTLARMSKEEGKNFGMDVEAGEHVSYLRMDNAKSNIMPPAKQARWFKLVSVDLNNGNDTYRADSRGVLEPCPEISQRGTVVEQILRLAAEYFEDSGLTGEELDSLPLDAVVEGIFGIAPPAAGSDGDIRKILMKECKTKRRIGPHLLWTTFGENRTTLHHRRDDKN